MENKYDFKLDGIGKIQGGVYKNLDVDGVTTIVGNIEAENIDIDGCVKSKGNIKCKNIKLDGLYRGNGYIEASERVTINGCPRINGDIQGKEIVIDGKVKVRGLVTGDKVLLTLSGKNYITEIGGEEVSVNAYGYVFWSKPLLTSDSIEADTINISNTNCKVVRGNDIRISRGCNIDRVEYTGTLKVDDRARVKEIVKL